MTEPDGRKGRYLVVADPADAGSPGRLVEADSPLRAAALWATEESTGGTSGRRKPPRVFVLGATDSPSGMVRPLAEAPIGVPLEGLVAVVALVVAAERIVGLTPTREADAMTEAAMVGIVHRGLDEGLVSARRAARGLGLTLDELSDLCVIHGHGRPYDL